MKRLPINLEPPIRSYAYDTFTNIVANNDSTTGKCLTKLTLSAELSECKVETHNVSIESAGHNIAVFGESFSTDMQVKITKATSSKQLFSVYVERNIMAHSFSRITFAVTGKRNEDGQLELWGIDLYASKKICKMHQEELSKVILQEIHKYSSGYLRGSVNNDQIIFEFSYDGDNWEDVACYEMKEELYSDIQVEIQIHHPSYMYYDWVFSNYITIRADLEFGLPLEYLSQPRKSFSYYTMNPLVSYQKRRFSFLTGIHKSLADYVKIMIDHDYYVELELDEYYVFETYASKRKMHYSHQNLIFGYDDEKKVFHCVSFVEGRTVESVIAMDRLDGASQFERTTDYFYTLECDFDEESIQFKMDYFLHVLKQYLFGIDDYTKYNGLAATRNVDSGVKIYDAILYDIKYKERFMHDVRISYLLYEHKKLMLERLSFIQARGFLNHEKMESLIQDYKEVYRLAGLLKNKMIKNKLLGTDKFDSRLKQIITNMKETEENVLWKLTHE